MPPQICMPPCFPVHLYVSRQYLHMIWGWGHPPHMFGALGEISTSVRHFGVCQYIHCFQSVGCFLLDWIILLDVCYALCCCTFLCNFIMSQVSTTSAMTSMPPVTVVSSGMSSLSVFTMAPSMMDFPATLGQCDVVLLTPRCHGDVIGLASVPQQQPPSMMLKSVMP